jgi:murein DD-endopeptidase MepM/ murein hydrolase activator NlpD
MLMLFLLQLGVPLLMLFSLWRGSATSKAGVALKVVAASAWLLAIDLAGLWTVLPWWTPRVLELALVALVVPRMATLRRLPALPSGVAARVWAGLSLAVTIAALLQSGAAISARFEPPGPVAEIASPLPQGTFLVVNGGGNRTVNAHVRTLSAQRRAWRGQSLGVDLIRVDTTGLRARGLRPADPSAYMGFGSRVVAPCTGPVIRAVDGLPDNLVPRADREQMAGNHVIVRCGQFDIVLAHLRQGTVKVSRGDHVTVGSPVGELGNSGNSDEPHLHVHAQRGTPPDAPFSAEPVPLRIDGRFLVRNQRVRGPG